MGKGLNYPKTNEKGGLTVTGLIKEGFSPEVVDGIFELNVDNRVEELIVGANMEGDNDNWIEGEDDELHNQALELLAQGKTFDDVEKFIMSTKGVNN